MKISNGKDKKLIQELKQKLEQEKTAIEKELKSFAQKDKKLKGDWDTRFPQWNGDSSSGSAMEIAADEVEEYSTLLPIEHSLELKLKDINNALQKLFLQQTHGKYGICEKCGKSISIERLKIYPEAKNCNKCK